MKEYGADINNREVNRGRCDDAIQWLIISLLAFIPFAFGVQSSWSKEVVVALSGAAVVFFLLKVVFSVDNRFVRTWQHFQALARDYSQVHWRLDLARLMTRTCNVSKAMTKAEIGLQIQPQLKSTKLFVEDLSVHPILVGVRAISP